MSASWSTPECLVFTAAAWTEKVYWQGQDRKTLRQTNLLIQEALRRTFEGICKPEPLREELAGFWSRHIDDASQLVYTVEGGQLAIIARRFHHD